MLKLSNTNAVILMIDFEKAGGGHGGGGDQKRFLELPRAEARQLKNTNQLEHFRTRGLGLDLEKTISLIIKRFWRHLLINSVELALEIN